MEEQYPLANTQMHTHAHAHTPPPPPYTLSMFGRWARSRNLSTHAHAHTHTHTRTVTRTNNIHQHTCVQKATKVCSQYQAYFPNWNSSGDVRLMPREWDLVALPNVTETERPLNTLACVLHISQRLYTASACSFSAVLSWEILDFRQQLSVHDDDISEGTAIE